MSNKENISAEEKNNRIRKLEQELANKDDFITYVHHELNNCIHNIHFFSDHLLEHWNTISNEETKKYIASITESSGYLRLLSQDLFDLSRFNAGKMQFNFKRIDLLESIKYSVDKCRKIFLVNKNLEILFKKSADYQEAYINGDNLRIKQLMFNLLTNSIKYSKEGTITVSVEEVTKRNILYWQINIIDQGIGIPKNSLNLVFEPFFKIPKKSNLVPSFGFGLPLCKKIVKAHNGSIDVVNNSDNKGVTFFYLIPQY